MDRRPARTRRAITLAALVLTAHAAAAEPAVVVPGPRDKCPVCGMFVARHLDWLAAARFADGTQAVFDGAKDLFRFWLELERHAPGRRRSELVRLVVTDYYAVRQVDARTAWYVIGSDVMGPMGRELVPFETEAGAREFLRDHHGTRLLRFDDVTPAVLKELG